MDMQKEFPVGSKWIVTRELASWKVGGYKIGETIIIDGYNSLLNAATFNNDKLCISPTLRCYVKRQGYPLNDGTYSSDYQEGDTFKVVNGEGVFTEGSVVSLSEDDGTNVPCFDMISGSIRTDCCFRATTHRAIGWYRLAKHTVEGGNMLESAKQYVGIHKHTGEALTGPINEVIDEIVYRSESQLSWDFYELGQRVYIKQSVEVVKGE